MKSRESKPQIIYYENELEDEFSKAQITPRKIDGTYHYEGGVLRKLGRCVLYYGIGRPLANLFLKWKFHHRIVNKECLKQVKGTGFFLYGNHTNDIADALIPSMIAKPCGVYVLVHPNNVSMPVLGRITPCLGAIPLPDDKEAMKHFTKRIEHVIGRSQCVTIYPEAHIWPYYTGIRNFKDSSFRYPAWLGVPVFCFTNTYQKRKRGRTPQIVTYVDGPFYPDAGLPVREQKKKLHEQVIAAMKRDCQHSNVELVRYISRQNERQT
ncbi:MAG: hypothetical protein IJ833_08000 [Lachnospiraceae bacterium]|nr:hypothetical protein [Lachnospiraceae bacterium]